MNSIKTSILFINIFLLSCNSDNSVRDAKATNDYYQLSLPTDTTKGVICGTALNEKQNEKMKNILLFAGHPISFYLEHRQIPQICKEIYLKTTPPTDDNKTLGLMDSLFTNNKETRPFYFLTLTETMKKADGAYAEPLGIMAKKFVEENTKEFLNYFINEPMMPREYLNEWAYTVAGEISIIAEKNEKKEADRIKRIMMKNCAECNEEEKQLFDDFMKKIYSSLPS
jgi:hypothetical protein